MIRTSIYVYARTNDTIDSFIVVKVLNFTRTDYHHKIMFGQGIQVVYLQQMIFRFWIVFDLRWNIIGYILCDAGELEISKVDS